MRRVKTDLTKLDELIAKQYEDIIRGIVKDSLQNSWEARINRKKGTDFRMVYNFYNDLDGLKNVLMLEDFGTVGMDNKRWEAFHSHWVSTKGASYSGGIGRWGQGKTLLLYFSEINTIITETIEYRTKKYRYSIRNNIGYVQLNDKPENSDPAIFKNSKDELKMINDFFPSTQPLNHAGTRIWILNVKDELVEDIKRGELSTSISESWWEIIRNYNIPIDVIVNGDFKRVKLPEFPRTVDKVDLHKLSINKEHGEIKRLKIVLADKEIRPSLRGIAIQRGGMTVLRYKLPDSTPEDLRKKCYGYCQMDKDLDKEMWAIELANHESFEGRKAVWVKLRRCIDSISEEFVLKHSGHKKQESLPLNLDKIIRTINKLVEEHLEGLGKSGRGQKNSEPSYNPTIPKPIRISPWGYEGNNKRFDRDDILQPIGALKNDTDSNTEVLFEAWVEGRNKITYWNYKIDNVKIKSNFNVNLELPEIELKKNISKKGIYYLKARISTHNKKTLHERSAIFYYKQEPPLTGG